MSDQLTNITNEPPYTDPTLKVFIYGLGTLWFDDTHDYAGFGFVEVPQNPHPLTLEICENGQIIFFEEISGDKTIKISGNSDNLGMGNQYQSSKHQDDDPQKPADDFRWMIDLDTCHQPPLEFISQPDFYGLINANVGDAIFFTGHKSEGNAVLKDLDGNTVNSPSPVGQVVGFCSQKDGAELTIDKSENLLPNPNGIYTVIIRYHCSNIAPASSSANSDFSQIYDVIYDGGNLQRYDLVYENQETPWISSCEMTKMTSHSQNIAAIFSQNSSLSLGQMNEIAGHLDYINHRLSCEVVCQDVIFGKYSRTVS